MFFGKTEAFRKLSALVAAVFQRYPASKSRLREAVHERQDQRRWTCAGGVISFCS
jgi:hypothetical protein